MAVPSHPHSRIVGFHPRRWTLNDDVVLYIVQFMCVGSAPWTPFGPSTKDVRMLAASSRHLRRICLPHVYCRYQWVWNSVTPRRSAFMPSTLWTYVTSAQHLFLPSPHLTLTQVLRTRHPKVLRGSLRPGHGRNPSIPQSPTRQNRYRLSLDEEPANRVLVPIHSLRSLARAIGIRISRARSSISRDT